MALLPECLIMQTGCATPTCHKAPSSSGQAGTGADAFSIFHLHQGSSVLGINEMCPLRTSQFLWGPFHLLVTPFLISPLLELQIPWNRSVGRRRMCPLQREGTSTRNDALGRTEGGSLGGTGQAELPSFPVHVGQAPQSPAGLCNPIPAGKGMQSRHTTSKGLPRSSSTSVSHFLESCEVGKDE